MEQDKSLENFNILTLGDTHGRDTWKIALFGSRKAYEKWRDVCEEGNPDMSKYPLFKYNKIVFIGDYVDSFTVSTIEIKHNLEEIIHLKLKFPEIVVLILGNHDIAYKDDQRCSGNKPEMLHDYKDLFRTQLKGESIFQTAYQYKDWLWTHAGVTLGFYNDVIKPLLSGKKEKRFTSFYKEAKNIAEILNFMYDSGNEDIFRVSYRRGGFSPVPGPFWTDKSELIPKPIYGINQIVGHTPCNYVMATAKNTGRYKSAPVTLCFIDNLEYGLNQVLALDFSTDPPGVEVIQVEV